MARCARCSQHAIGRTVIGYRSLGPLSRWLTAQHAAERNSLEHVSGSGLLQAALQSVESKTAVQRRRLGLPHRGRKRGISSTEMS